MDEKTRADADAEAPRDCMIHWMDSDGSVRSAGPLSRSRAESLVQAYQELSPQRCYRVAPVPRELETARAGRIRHHRRFAAPKLQP